MQIQATPSKVHSFIKGGQVRAFDNFDVNHYRSLDKLGIYFKPSEIKKMIANDSAIKMNAMDELQPLVTTPSMTTPIQFLQNWLPGYVHVITQARNIDLIVGLATVGSFEDVQIVQGIMELTGLASAYGDYSVVPFASWNTNFNYQNIIRFEQGLQVGVLEALTSARANVDSAASKRTSCALALDIARNAVGFYGYLSGAYNTYGLLNDPGLPAYLTAATGASGDTTWASKTYLEIIADILAAISELRTQSGDQIDPKTTDVTLAVATASVDYLSQSTDFGYSPYKWLKENYPRIRVVSAPELDGANGGENVFYLFADRINDSSTDDGQTFIQVVPARSFLVGVSQQTKGFQEDYANATAGVMCKRPWATTRTTGI